MFELCAAKHQVIMEYEQDKMLLIAIRDNVTGDYFPLSTLVEESQDFNVPMVLLKYIYINHSGKTNRLAIWKRVHKRQVLANLNQIHGQRGGVVDESLKLTD